MIDSSAERQFLEKVYTTYTVDTSAQTKVMRKLIFDTFSDYLDEGSALELGCSDGFMTNMIAGRVSKLDIVDGSKKFLERAAMHAPKNCRFVYSLFEEFEPSEKYDYIFASYILEHVRDPVFLLNRIHDMLKPNGYLFIVVPNSRALSRQMALRMGLLGDLKELTQNDIAHGHRRVYDRFSLEQDIAAGRMKTIAHGGIMLKILADFQLDKLLDSGFLTTTHIDALQKLGMEYPDLCGSLFSVCKRNTLPT